MVKPDKSRYVYLYLPSAEEKAKWEKLANDAGVPLTKFVIEIVQDALSEDTEIRPRGQLTKEITALRKETKELRDELKLKTIVLDKYEAELKRYRSVAFMDDDFKGSRKHNKELVKLLKQGGTIDSYKILETLSIDPTDSELAKAISRQLEDLESYGLIAPTPKGWRWVG